jgi:hypothetical protein
MYASCTFVTAQLATHIATNPHVPQVKPEKIVAMLGTVMPTPADAGLNLDDKG